MNDLSAEAREILESGRAAMTPADLVRHRIREAVAARVAAGPAVAAVAGGSAMKLVLLSGLVIGAMAVGAVIVARQVTDGPAAPAGVVEHARTEPPAGASEAPAPTVRELPPEAPAAAIQSRPRRKPAARAGLAAEVALLEEARAALRGARPAEAIAALDRHRSGIPSPQLEREALLLRAEAVCATGERDEGERVLEEIENRWPGAGGVEAVRDRCRR